MLVGLVKQIDFCQKAMHFSATFQNNLLSLVLSVAKCRCTSVSYFPSKQRQHLCRGFSRSGRYSIGIRGITSVRDISELKDCDTALQSTCCKQDCAEISRAMSH